jgi:hypothetical protein
MTLNPVPSHPSSLCYVLKLHRDSQPARGQISGLLEHVGSGHTIGFADAEALIAALLAHAATAAAEASSSRPPRRYLTEE